MRHSLTVLLLSLALFGCNRQKCKDPQPQCFYGVVVGSTCLDGILIDVQTTDPIGQPVGSLGNHVIAAVNFEDFTGLNQVGQRVYFTYRNDPARTGTNRFCTANTVLLPVPHLVLNNLSATACITGE